MTLVIIALMCVSVFCFYAGRKSGETSGYWKGRGTGWKDCEDMVIKRMVEHGYDKEKVWEDLIQ